MSRADPLMSTVQIRNNLPFCARGSRGLAPLDAILLRSLLARSTGRCELSRYSDTRPGRPTTCVASYLAASPAERFSGWMQSKNLGDKLGLVQFRVGLQPVTAMEATT